MEHGGQTFLPLLIVVGLAFLVPVALSRIRRVFIPIVVGEIIAGMIVGESGFRLVCGVDCESPLLGFLSAFGFTYLMFLSGLEIDFSEVLRSGEEDEPSPWRRLAGNQLFIGVLTFVLTLALSVVAALFLKGAGIVDDPWIVALILSTTSLGVVVPVLKERGLVAERYGQLILVSALAADFISILLISVYALFHTRGLSVEITLVLVLLAVFAVVYHVATIFQRHLPAQRFFERLSTATSQIRVRGALALALVFIVLAETMGTENILGAFLAGVIVSMLSRHEGSLLRQKLDAVGYGFFIPIFFIMVGVNFNLPALMSSRSSLLLVPILVAAAFIVKLAPSLVYRLSYSWRETLAAGVLMSSRLSLIIAAAAIGLKLGIITEAFNSAVILVAVISCLAAPILFNLLAPSRPEGSNLVLIVGRRRLAEMLAHRLLDHGMAAVQIITDLNGGGEADEDAERPLGEVVAELKGKGIEAARTVVAMEENDEENLRLCRLARLVFGVENVVAWVQNPAHNPKFQQLGIHVMNPTLSSLLILEGMVVHPLSFSAPAEGGHFLEIREVEVKNPRLIGAALREVELMEDVDVLMVRRGGESMVPDEDTVLQAGDAVSVAGAIEDVENAIYLFERGR